MEDHRQQQQFGMYDLRQLVNGARSAHFQAMLPAQTTADLFSTHRNLNPNSHPHQHEQPLEMLMFRPHQVADVMPPVLADFASDSISTPSTVAAPVVAGVATDPIATASTPSLNGFEVETAGCLGVGGDATNGRWPRQETLTLLEIRSRLDPKFKETNQKGPLWDEVSRILSEEHGYQRSGKKCREKFENLYKYYKKTKEGKVGRQDGKNYRFFRQLEALCGESSCNPTSAPDSNFVGSSFGFQAAIGQTPSIATYENFQPAIKHCDCLSLANTTEFDTSSTDVNDLSNEALEEIDSEKRRKRSSSRSRWKAKIRNFIDSQMKKLMEKQEAWLERLTKILEQNERERMLREEEWRKQEAARLEREHKFWARERAWIEARNDALMETLQKLTGREIKGNSTDHHVDLMAADIQNHSENNRNEDGSEILNGVVRVSDQSWSDSEITSLIQMMYEMGFRFQQCGCSEPNVWEEMAAKMARSGYEQRSGLIYKNKWESIQKCNRNIKESNKKRKENARDFYYESIDQPSLCNQGSGYCDVNDAERQETERFRDDIDGCSPSNSNAGNAVSDSCFRFFMTEGESLWENYGMKLNKLPNQNQ